ncbi:MAG: hypothetical protein GW941_00885 [Candidatus Pacebacteria bacterium]|nr:hypothetical protein [Candidatus Paceibacterota bacterium]
MTNHYSYRVRPLDRIYEYILTIGGLVFIIYSLFVKQIFTFPYFIFFILLLIETIKLFLPKKSFSGRIVKKDLITRTNKRSGRSFYHHIRLDNKKTLNVPGEVYAVLEVDDYVNGFSNFFGKDIEEIKVEFTQARDINKKIIDLGNDQDDLAWKKRSRTIILLIFISILLFYSYIYL